MHAADPSSVVELRDVLLDRGLELRVISSRDLILLLPVEEEEEAGLASEGTVLQLREHILGDVLRGCAKELHFDEIFIESHEKVPVVLLHGVTAAAPGQMRINAEKLLVVFRLEFLLEMLHAFDSEEYLSFLRCSRCHITSLLL